MAQRSGFDAVFLNDQGQPLTDLNIRVLDTNGNQVQVYETKTGTSLKPQPITTISANKGLVQFWAEPGYYQVEVSDTQIPARIATRVVPFDAVAGDASLGSEGISLSQLPIITNSKIGDNAITESKIADRQVSTLKIKEKAVDWGEINNNAIRNNHILDAQVTPNKLSPYGGNAFLQGDVPAYNSQWNTILQLNLNQSGVYLVMVSGIHYNDQQGGFLLTIDDTAGSFGTWGMLMPGGNYQNTTTAGGHVHSYWQDRHTSFSQHNYGYSANGNFRLRIYSYGGKQGVGSGSYLTAVRLG